MLRASNTLFGEAIRARPTRRDQAVKDRAVKMCLDALRTYCPQLRWDAAEEALTNAMDTNRSDDAYELAKALEKRGYDADALMVSTLDIAPLSTALDEEIRAWVTHEGIEPSLAVGDTVQLKDLTSAIAALPLDADRTGTIIRIDRERAAYVVNIPALGHVSEEQAHRSPRGGTTGLVFAYETLEG